MNALRWLIQGLLISQGFQLGIMFRDWNASGGVHLVNVVLYVACLIGVALLDRQRDGEGAKIIAHERR